MSNASLASEYVTDTMGLVLRLEHRQMAAEARAIFAAADAGQTIVHIPAMVFAEILYLSEKGRIGVSMADVDRHLHTFPNYRECSMNYAVIETAAEITDIHELHDRLIGATARWLKVALITNDPVIQRSAFVATIW
ncbi:MAG: PIN domain-containing protein [Blastocatellia bacterium]